ncbi:MAG: hypothetical protein Udaeo2_12010 [Candidatus Udaeobacter sp.]|nr:MAG: hypothetical protein Udaeo2_12010 [Candidatus Udaeobacter sp.]
MAVLGLVTLASARSCADRDVPAATVDAPANCTPHRVSGTGCRLWPLPRCQQFDGCARGHARVAALATQNVLVKLVLKGVPSTAVMTTNITQLTVDPAILVRSKETRPARPGRTPGTHDILLRNWGRRRL